MSKELKHWQASLDEQGYLWLGLNIADAAYNVLSEAVMLELEGIISTLGDEAKAPKGLVIHSLKKNSFILGADINEFSAIENEEMALALIERGQNIFLALSKLSIPSLAIINGNCLGGGLELALACDYRIAVKESNGRLGLPEVMLGIHPGWGGSIRLPRLIGISKAMPLMLSGRMMKFSEGKRTGLLDALVPERVLNNAVPHFLSKGKVRDKLQTIDKILNQAYVRKQLAKVFKKAVAKKARKEHYPAPYALIDNWQQHGVAEAAYGAEAQSVARLILTDTAKNLVRVFHLREGLQKLAKTSDFKCEHLHVIGAGTMGQGIAIWCVQQGIRVTLQDNNVECLTAAVKNCHRVLRKRLKEKHLVAKVMDRFIPDFSGDGVKSADIVLEAIIEDEKIKAEVLARTESKMKPGTILATNTSSIPLEKLVQGLKHPENLVGIHFFNPVDKMQLIEIIHGEQTGEMALGASFSFAEQIKRLPLPVKDSPGFLVNRVLMPYLLASVKLLEAGNSVAMIDEAALAFGMPMGPLKLADTVGLDICLSVAKHMQPYFDFDIPGVLQKMCDEGKLGVKSGAGFYQYHKGKAKRLKKAKALDDEKLAELQSQLVAALVSEAEKVFDEEIVSEGDWVDVGMIFGAGFAPFRGGPLRYASAIKSD